MNVGSAPQRTAMKLERVPTLRTPRRCRDAWINPPSSRLSANLLRSDQLRRLRLCENNCQCGLLPASFLLRSS